MGVAASVQTFSLGALQFVVKICVFIYAYIGMRVFAVFTDKIYWQSVRFCEMKD